MYLVKEKNKRLRSKRKFDKPIFTNYLRKSTSEWKLHIGYFVRIRTTYFKNSSESELHVFCRFPNQNFILSESELHILGFRIGDFRIRTTYLKPTSEWKLHIFPNENYILKKSCGKLLWKKSDLSTISESKLHIFPQRPNQNSIFILKPLNWGWYSSKYPNQSYILRLNLVFVLNSITICCG